MLFIIFFHLLEVSLEVYKIPEEDLMHSVIRKLKNLSKDNVFKEH
jgi:hypothetical protein